jgi:hypothetical protein
MEKQPTKTEAELIASVANIHDAEACLRFAQRAIEKGHLALAAACHERAQALKPVKAPGVKKKATQGDKGLMKTHATVELALPILIEDYKTGKDPTTVRGTGRPLRRQARAVVWAGYRSDRCRLRARERSQLRPGSRAAGKRQHQRRRVRQRIQPFARPYHRDGDGWVVDRRGLRGNQKCAC